MIRRIGIGVIIIGGLLLLILYSQYRTHPSFVSGIVETDEIRLGLRVGGRIRNVFVGEGDHVKRGASLVEFEPYDLLQRERQAEAELKVREAELKQLMSGLRPEEVAQAKARVEQLAAQLKLLELGPRQEEIEAAKERLNATNAVLLLAKREFERSSNLVRTGAISQSDFDIARETLDAATANVAVSQNELAILVAGTRAEKIDEAQARVQEATLAWELAKKGYRVEEVEKAQAAREAAAAALEVIRKQKAELTIFSPSNGYVDALDLQAGDLVASNAPVLTLLSNQRLWVRAYVPQKFIDLVVGQSLRVTFDSLPNQDFIGTLTFVSHVAEFTPSNVQTSDERAKQVYRIRIVMDDPDAKLRAGMTANVWVGPVGNGLAQ